MKITLKVTLAVWMMICLLFIALSAMAENPAGNGGNNSSTIDGSQGSAMPARIELRDERAHVTADDADNIKLTAFVYDAQGNPVADGYKINFTIGSATDNNFTDNGSFDYVPGAMGRLGSPDNSNNFYRGVTKNGSASVQFGWIDEFYSGNNSTIWAYSADNASVFANIKIYSAAPMDSLTGYVVDTSGAGLGGINVKMHVMGVDYTNSTPNRTIYYEIYNMVRTTSNRPPSVGRFSFDYIVLTGAAYGYVDAEAQVTENLTVYGKSDNFSMNRSATSIGNITLGTPTPKVTMPGPSVAVKPTPGFETLFMLAGSLGTAYLMAKKYA